MAPKKGGGRGGRRGRGQAFVEDPPRVVGDNKERDIALNAALEEHCRLQDQEDALIEKYIAPIREKKAEVKAKVKKDWEIPTAAFNARAALRMIELGDDPEVVLATQQMFDATPVGANLDLVAIAEKVSKKKAEEKAESDAKAKAKEEKKTKATRKEVEASVQNQGRIPMAIDGGSKSAYCYWAPGLLKPKFGIINLPKTDNVGRFCNAMAEELGPFAREIGVTELAIEAPIIVKHKHKNAQPCPVCGQTKSDLNIYEVDKLFGVVHALEMVADSIGIPSRRIARSSVCLHFIGTGRGKRDHLKNSCVVACQRKGWNITDQDCADAGATLDKYTWDEKIKVPWDNQPLPGPLFSGLKGVHENDIKSANLKVILKSADNFTRPKT